MENEIPQTKKQRIELIDALRGLAVILMVLHHFLFDLVEFLGAPEWLFSNPVFNILHYIFAGVFIVLSGVSSNFSRSNLKRGLQTLAAALLISGVTHKFWEKLPKAVMPVFCVPGAVISAYCVANIEVESTHLWIFGWTAPDFVSYDYFPLFPWIFIFLFGTWLGSYIKAGKFPDWFYKTKVPVLPAVGRHALIIYLAHQPVLYGVTMLIKLCLAP